MQQQTVVAHFDSRDQANEAVRALVDAGVARNAIKLMPEAQQAGYQRSGSAYDHTRDEGGFWSSLGSLSLPEEDRYAYAEGMSRGGVTLTVASEPSQAMRIAEIVDSHGAVDMDEREEAWRSEGWSGYATTSSGSTARGTSRASARDGEAVPIVEEQLHIGKRQVMGGKVRVRSYVVETPVEEQVTLRQEHVEVERRPVDRTLSPEEQARLLQERTVVVEERGEQAVVSKQARVKEEVVVNKTAEERVETVSDTVRRTEVEVEDERARIGRLSGQTGKDKSSPRR